MASTNDESFREQLEKISAQKKMESWIPVCKRILPDAHNFYDHVREIIKKNNASTNEKATEAVRIKVEGVADSDVRLKKNKDGKWTPYPTGIYPCLDALRKVDVDGALRNIQKLLQMKIAPHLPINVIHKLINEYPIFGLAFFFRYQSALTHFEEMGIETLDRSHVGGQWADYPSFLEQAFIESTHAAENCIKDIDVFFESLNFDIDDELSRSFIADLRKDLEGLILECLYQAFSFSYGSESCPGPVASQIAPILFPITSDDYANYRNAIDSFIETRMKPALQGDYSEKEIKDFIVQNENNQGAIKVPCIYGIIEITQFLRLYEQMWMYIRGGFENKKAFHIRKKEDRTYIDSDYGPSILLRPKAIKDGLKRRGARIGIDLPLQDGTSFGLRIDRDEYTQSMTIDYGNLEIYHALALAGYTLHLGELTPPHDPYRRISFFNAEMIQKKGESD